MKSGQAFDRQMVVLELDGSAVHDHTPSELIRAGFPQLYGPDRFQAVLSNSLAFGLKEDPKAVGPACAVCSRRYSRMAAPEIFWEVQQIFLIRKKSIISIHAPERGGTDSL